MITTRSSTGKNRPGAAIPRRPLGSTGRLPDAAICVGPLRFANRWGGVGRSAGRYRTGVRTRLGENRQNVWITPEQQHDGTSSPPNQESGQGVTLQEEALGHGAGEGAGQSAAALGGGSG